MTKIYITEYSTNNSWWGRWLDNKDWEALEKAWRIVMPAWTKFIYKDWNHIRDERWVPIFEKSDESRYDVPHYAWYMWSMSEAIQSFEEATWQDANEEWCPCCWQPHNFYEKSLDI